MTAVTEAELWFGVRTSGSKKLERAVVGFLDAVLIFAFDRAAARSYGTLRALLEARGTPIGIADTMIAAQALASGCIMVTNNRRHFRRVPRLVTEDWS